MPKKCSGSEGRQRGEKNAPEPEQEEGLRIGVAGQGNDRQNKSFYVGIRTKCRRNKKLSPLIAPSSRDVPSLRPGEGCAPLA